eukprot:4638175-Alexandrium_andersonii.AAC.1
MQASAAPTRSQPWTLPVHPNGSARCRAAQATPPTRTTTASKNRCAAATGTRRYAESTSAFHTAGAATSAPSSSQRHRTNWSTVSLC